MSIGVDSFVPDTAVRHSYGESPVGVMTFEVRCEAMVRQREVWFFYHIPCFYRMRQIVDGLGERERWSIQRKRMILLDEAEQEEYRCDCPGCGKFLFDSVL